MSHLRRSRLRSGSDAKAKQRVSKADLPRLSRFSPEETDLIRRVAERTDSTYSEVVRRAVRALGQPWHAEAGTTTNLFVAGPAEPNQGLKLEQDGPPEATRTGRMAQPR